jgi:hypothetical protein
MVETANAKSAYLVANHHTSQFDAWNINPGGTINYVNKYSLKLNSPSGIGMYVPPQASAPTYGSYLFISFEFGAGLEVIDSTFNHVEISSGPSDLAGIAVDDPNGIVYALYRMSRNLYAFNLNPTTGHLTAMAGFPKSLPGTSQGLGIALDETTGTLWVADGGAGVARAYDTSTWTEDVTKSFTPSHKPVDIIVDRVRQCVYTVSMSAGAWVPSGCGSNLLSKYDLATDVETTINMGRQGVGISVDEVTGYVYITHRYLVTAWNTSTTPFTQVDSKSVSGSAAGICIPQGEPPPPACLHVKALDDGLAAGECVDPGGTLSYQADWTNQKTGQQCGTAHNAKLWADLAPEVNFVSASGGGTYDSGTHRITWNLGDVAGGASGSETFDVQVDPSTVPGSTITTYCSIDSDDTNVVTVSEQTNICCPSADLWMVEYRWSTDPNHQPPYTMTVNPDGSVTLDAYMEARIENQGSGDAINVTANISSAPGYVTIIDGDLTFGDVPAGTTDWSDDDYHIRLVCRGPTDDQISWDIEYYDECGNHHVITGVPEFPPAPPLADVLPQLKNLWIPEPPVTKLYPNYPNPFNPETWIPYQIVKDADVTVRIFDTRGQLVKTINFGHQEAGFYISRGKAAYWDGRNQWGEKVSSGVYFYTLHAGDFTATRRMVIMK